MSGVSLKIRKMIREDKGLLIRMVKKTGIFREKEIVVAMEVMDSYLKGTPDYKIHVALKDGRPAGFACYGLNPISDGTYDLYWIVIDPLEQVKGIGKTLASYIEEEIRKEGGRLIVAETSSSPAYKPAHRFYERMGYRKVAEIKDFYAIGDNKLIFVKDLSLG